MFCCFLKMFMPTYGGTPLRLKTTYFIEVLNIRIINEPIQYKKYLIQHYYRMHKKYKYYVNKIYTYKM